MQELIPDLRLTEAAYTEYDAWMTFWRMIAKAGIAMVGAWVTLRALDFAVGESFRGFIKVLKGHPPSLATYLSVRFAVVFGSTAYLLGGYL